MTVVPCALTRMSCSLFLLSSCCHGDLTRINLVMSVNIVLGTLHITFRHARRAAVYTETLCSFGCFAFGDLCLVFV